MKLALEPVRKLVATMYVVHVLKGTQFLLFLSQKHNTAIPVRTSGKRWSTETEVRKRKYGNENTEASRE